MEIYGPSEGIFFTSIEVIVKFFFLNNVNIIAL